MCYFAKVVRPLVLLSLCLSACFPVAAPHTTVRGQVLYGPEDAAQALEGAFVRLVESGSDAPPRVATTAENGEYRFDDVPEGAYAIFFTTERWVYESNVSQLITVVANTNVASVYDFVVPAVRFSPAGGLKGKVVALTEGGQYEGIVINLEGTAFQARAAMDGSFDFGRLPVKQYRATAIGRGVVSEKPVEVAVNPEKESDVVVYIQASLAPVNAPNRPPVLPAGIEFEKVPPDASTNPTRLFDSSLLGPNQIVRGTKARFSCKASDPDGDPLVYSWQVSGGTQKQLSADSIEWSALAGAASIRCTVTDSQGAFVTATTSIDVRDFRMNGAALAGGVVVFSQSDPGTPDFDLVGYDVATKTYSRFSAPGNQIRPRVYGTTVVYGSDSDGTADNPSDVFAMALPSAAEIRLTSTSSVEAYDVGPAGIVYANNSGTTCQLLRRSTVASAPVAIFPINGALPEPNAACDRVIVGNTTVLFREATKTTVRWRLLTIGTGATTDAPMDWITDDEVSAAYVGARYVVAIPSTRQVLRFDEGNPLAATMVTTLPELAGTIVSSVSGDALRIVSSAYDTSGLFGTVRISIAAGGTKNIDVDGPRAVLAAQGSYALVGRPHNFESPPGEELELYDMDALP